MKNEIEYFTLRDIIVNEFFDKRGVSIALARIMRKKGVMLKKCPIDNEYSFYFGGAFFVVTVDNIRAYNIETGKEFNKDNANIALLKEIIGNE